MSDGLRITLPAIHPGNRGRALALAYLGFSILYLSSGHLHWRRPAVLEPWSVDRSVPFLGWTIWIYLSQFLFLFLSIWLFRDNTKRSHTFYGMLLATVIACAIFLAWPTTVIRPDVELAACTGFLWRALYLTDTPANCFPSLHVAFAGLATTAMVPEGRFWCCLAPLWAGLIMLSTLTTKQHYSIDILGGLALTVLCYGLVRRFLRYPMPNE